MTIDKIVLDSINQVKNNIGSALKKTNGLPECSNIDKNIEEYDEKNSGNVNVINSVIRNKRLTIMVVGAASGLIFCLLILTTYKNDLPGEVVGIVSTVAGIFGACLKDAYSCEFSSTRKKDVQQTITEKLKY